jgi:hypothetical protein
MKARFKLVTGLTTQGALDGDIEDMTDLYLRLTNDSPQFIAVGPLLVNRDHIITVEEVS